MYYIYTYYIILRLLLDYVKNQFSSVQFLCSGCSLFASGSSSQFWLRGRLLLMIERDNRREGVGTSLPLLHLISLMKLSYRGYIFEPSTKLLGESCLLSSGFTNFPSLRISLWSVLGSKTEISCLMFLPIWKKRPVKMMLRRRGERVEARLTK